MSHRQYNPREAAESGPPAPAGRAAGPADPAQRRSAPRSLRARGAGAVTGCGHVHAVWKSCGNRHCPSCQRPAPLRRRDMTGTPVGTRRKLRSRDRIGTARPSGTGQHDQTPGGHARAHESCHEAKDGGMSPTRRTGRSIVRTDTMRVPSLTRREGMRFADKSLNCN